MTTDRGALAALLATMTVLGATATPAVAQTEPAAPVRGLERLQNPGTQSSPDATAIPVPDAPTIVLPNTNSAPRRAPRSSAGAKPATDRAANSGRAAAEGATRERAAARTTPESTTQSRDPERDAGRTVTSAEPAPIATPIPAPTPAPAPQSQSAPTPVTETTPQPVAPTTATVPAANPASTLSAPETGRTMPLWLSLTAIVVVLGALWALRRKPRSQRSDRIERQTDVEAVSLPVEPSPAEPVRAESIPAKPSASEPTSTPTATIPAARAAASSAVPGAAVPAAAPKFLEPRAKTPPPPPRARLTCDLRPLRAGLNLLSATVECEMVVTNTGTAPAEGIRAGIALLTAHADQDVDLAAFNAAPVVRPATPPFTLAPGETRTIRAVTAIARDAIRTMTAANRPMFVPVVATNILYATAGDDAQTARAWVVGIERVDSAKLAPFWLDAPPRMYTTVAARPHAVTFDR